MKKLTWILLTLCLTGRVFADDTAWRSSFPEAADQASRGGKLLLLDFTGSDWCGWCMKLDAETFSRAEFLDYASRNLVLVKLDFPMHKAQSDDVKEANRALKRKYAVNGFPTVIIAKPDGTVLWSQPGYVPGGPRVMIDAVNQCRKAAGLGAPLQAAAPAPPPKPAVPIMAAIVQRPAPPLPPPGEVPRLQGIVYSTSHATAVLNGETCEAGETINGARVLKIGRNTVTVEFQGQTKILSMK
jgi:protein disulfide-isomerase